jgi:hypothetical protein
MKKLSALLIAGTALVSLAAAPSAVAATDFGALCTPTSAPPNVTMVQLAAAPGSPSLTAPISGVLTKWKSSFPAPGAFVQKMKILRPTGVPNQFQTIAEDTRSLGAGENVFDVRLPIKAGDRLGLYGNTPAGALICTGKPGDVTAEFKGDATTGSVNAFTPLGGTVAVPVAGVIEPDGDGDGYGDETQDKCPQSAAFQTECPTVSLDALALAGRRSATALVTTSSRGLVSITGTVRLPKAGKKGKAKTLVLSAPAQTVEPGRLGRFALAFPKSLQKALKALPPKRSLALTVTVTATDVINRVTATSLLVKLKGQG